MNESISTEQWEGMLAHGEFSIDDVKALLDERDGLKEIIASRYSFNSEIRALTDERDKARDEVERLREACTTLLNAAEMSRAWEVLSNDEFDEIYPSLDGYGWASGDVDENLCCAMEDARVSLTPPV